MSIQGWVHTNLFIEFNLLFFIIFIIYSIYLYIHTYIYKKVKKGDFIMVFIKKLYI